MARYEEKVIDEVQSLNDIVDVVSSYVPLKRSGRTFKALCPFHQEKTPSFIVHPEKQIFHCFGCSVGGNVFSFVMKYENLTFPEALRNLAGRVHFTLPEPARAPGGEGISESEELYEIYRLAQEYYSANFKHPEKGHSAREYLRERGFGEEVLETLPLGWATSEWRGLFEFLSRKGIRDTAFYRSGLIQRSREGNPYDLFRGRLLFPIMNLQGKVIAFGGRALGEETPKYLNSPESAIFRKRRELFGLHLAKRSVSPEGPGFLIVEGYFDFLRVYLSGFRNVVATLGTALTEEHVRVLRRFVPEVTVVFDGDRAGEAASLRGLEIFLEGELNVKLVTLPSGEDPDTLIAKEGKAAFENLLNQASDFFDFKWQSLRKRHDPEDATGLVRISNEFLETFTKIKSPVLLDLYFRRLAQRLSVEENSLRKEFMKFQAKARGRENFPSSPPRSLPADQFPEEGILIALLLEDSLLLEKAAETLRPDDFQHPGAREVFQILVRSRESGTKVATSHVFNRVEEESIKSYVARQSLSELSQPEKEKAFADCLRKIQQKKVNERLEKLRRAISQAEGGGQQEKVTELLNEYRTLLAERS